MCSDRFILSFMFACFTNFFPSLSFHSFWAYHTRISSLQTHKTSPCSCDCVICFAFVVVGLFLSLPTTNKHGKWETVVKTSCSFVSFIPFVLCSPEIKQFLSALLFFIVPFYISSFYSSPHKNCSVSMQ